MKRHQYILSKERVDTIGVSFLLPSSTPKFIMEILEILAPGEEIKA